MRTIRVAALALALAMPLGACSTVSNLATSLSTSSPTQATTLAEAIQAATVATMAVDVYVNTGNPNVATLNELKLLNDGLHTALVNLQAANAAGQSLAMAAFNEALAAFQTYGTSKGISL